MKQYCLNKISPNISKLESEGSFSWLRIELKGVKSNWLLFANPIIKGLDWHFFVEKIPPE